MIKFGETSPLELPVILLKKVFPFVQTYYGDNNHSPDAYEHIYTGFISSLIFACLMFKYDKIFVIGVISAFIVHVIWKEIIHDNPKHPIGSMTDGQWLNYKVDMILRCSGFVLGLPFVMGAL